MIQKVHIDKAFDTENFIIPPSLFTKHALAPLLQIDSIQELHMLVISSASHFAILRLYPKLKFEAFYAFIDPFSLS
jgi:hypothetical protein